LWFKSKDYQANQQVYSENHSFCFPLIGKGSFGISDNEILKKPYLFISKTSVEKTKPINPNLIEVFK
jgi:hypothetical protein